MEWIDVHSGQASTREQILAACTGWVTVLLNMFTGIGNGNLYQRRWKVYWITVAVAVTLLSADAIATIRNKNHSQQIGGLGCC